MSAGIALFLAFSAAGCTGSLFQSKQVPPTVYMLSPAATASMPPPGATPAAPVPVDLAILKPTVRAGLNSDRVAVLYPDRRLDFFAGARWSGPLDEVLQDLAVQAFIAGARLRHVGSDASAFASSYWLEFDVVDFQAEYTAAGGAPVVHVRFTAQLGAAADRRVVGRFDVQGSATAGENRLTEIVDAYDRAANSALAQLGGQTAAVLAAIPAAVAKP